MSSPRRGIWVNSMIDMYGAYAQRRQHGLLCGSRSHPSPRSAICNGCRRSDAERIKATFIAHGAGRIPVTGSTCSAGTFLRSQRSEQDRRINSAAERDNQRDIRKAWQQLCQA